MIFTYAANNRTFLPKIIWKNLGFRRNNIPSHQHWHGQNWPHLCKCSPVASLHIQFTHKSLQPCPIARPWWCFGEFKFWLMCCVSRCSSVCNIVISDKCISLCTQFNHYIFASTLLTLGNNRRSWLTIFVGWGLEDTFLLYRERITLREKSFILTLW